LQDSSIDNVGSRSGARYLDSSGSGGQERLNEDDERLGYAFIMEYFQQQCMVHAIERSRHIQAEQSGYLSRGLSRANDCFNV
jgi:hypothetical protein